MHSAVGSRLREREVVEFLLRLVDPAEHDRRLLCGEAVLRLDHLSGHRIELVSNVVETCLDAGDFFFDRVQLRAVAVGKERADEVADAFADRPQLTGLQFSTRYGAPALANAIATSVAALAAWARGCAAAADGTETPGALAKVSVTHATQVASARATEADRWCASGWLVGRRDRKVACFDRRAQRRSVRL